jgi:RNA 2',3'-cyclic 3'-phosphodiesterase
VSIIRAFIGIDFSEKLKNEISILQERISKYAIKGRWKDIENLHLTLKFLGEINKEQQLQINKAIMEIYANKKIGTFKLLLRDCGTFGFSNNNTTPI